MDFYLVTVFSFSILIPGIMALLFIKSIASRYYPFIFCLWIGCINELLSFLLGCYHYHTLANNNIYVLLESVLLILYFNETKELYEKRSFYFLISFLVFAWILDNFIFKSITSNSTYFRIIYSLLIVVLSINLINNLLFQNHDNLFKNADFILCLCFVIYFTYKAMIQAVTVYGVKANLAFWKRTYDIMVYINLGVNLLYIFAILWMRKKTRFILPLS